MSQRTVVLALAGNQGLARDLVAGGVFVPGERLELGEDCALVLRGPGAELVVTAKCVWVGDAGSGLQLVGCDADLKARIAELAQAATDELPAAAEPDGDSASAGDDLGEPSDDRDERKAARSVNERLRGLTLVQQLKVAQHGEISERVLLERMYGKNVWEALLRNPRITGPEVARIARMGALPRPLIEVIIGNGGWLQIPEVRRALLSNPRLGTDQIQRVLRLLPKHELKLAGVQTAYPFAVRDAAKRLLRELAGS